MPRNRERLNRAMKPLMTLCWVALMAACTPPAGDAGATAPAAASGQASPAGKAADAPATVADTSAGCADAASPAQTLVCKDPTLTGLDADMGKAVTAAQATLDAAGQSKLHAEQQRWQEHTRDLCTDAQCLRQVYADRLKVLSATRDGLVDQDACEAPDGQQQCVDLLVLRDPNSQLANFNTLLGENGQEGRLLGCTAATNMGGGANALLAANCTQETSAGRRTVQLCSNQMVGQFALEPAPAAYGTQAIRQLLGFTQQHCAG
ncbi:hypothetical protein JY411_17270 [Stenotrophomonas maltophilia]|nr:hypothetical protein [Stenotrophomonas maltophilia]MBN4968335.1 hypothetical protein [Stenotrophomonas maltophilia]